jgi:hypothetical protein
MQRVARNARPARVTPDGARARWRRDAAAPGSLQAAYSREGRSRMTQEKASRKQASSVAFDRDPITAARG